ncbi:hypothetical protein Tco_0274252 [Tanacetum coccineum]
MDRVPYASAVGSLMYAMVCKELLWLKKFLQELGFKQQRYAVLCDNQSTIHLDKNSMFHKRTKHIDIRYHWIRDAIEDGMFELNKVHTDDNASRYVDEGCSKRKVEDLLLVRRDGELILIDRKWGRFVGYFLSP